MFACVHPSVVVYQTQNSASTAELNRTHYEYLPIVDKTWQHCQTHRIQNKHPEHLEHETVEVEESSNLGSECEYGPVGHIGDKLSVV